MSKLEKEAYELYRAIWSSKLLKEEQPLSSAPSRPVARRCRIPKPMQFQSIRKAG